MKIFTNNENKIILTDVVIIIRVKIWVNEKKATSDYTNETNTQIDSLYRNFI
jgi:hypothetical protein